jgi:glycosyltransferase involved in cell wall biosynthesis
VSPPHLLQIVPSLGGGSLARTTLDAAQAAIAAGGSAIVASAGGMLVPELLRLRGTHLELPENRHPFWARLSLPSRLAASLRNSTVNVVQARTPAMVWVARSVARRLNVPSIATLHRPLVAASAVERFVEHRQARADALVAVSDHVAQDALVHMPSVADRQETIAPGINLDRFNPATIRADRVIRLASDLRIPDGRYVVISATRAGGDPLTLIKAMKRLQRDDVFCLLLGSSDAPTAHEKDLERAILQAELQGRVQLGPYVEDMAAAYMLADAVVATGGARQGSSRALIEAQAMGRPVVAEEGGGAAEAVLPGVTGWLAAEDDAASLAEAIDSALSLTAERRADLARAAQDHVRGRYALAQSNTRLLQLYERLADKGG